MKLDEIQQEELKTWNIEDETKRQLKLERERVRYPKMFNDLGLNLLDLTKKICVDIGAGPKGLLADINCKYKIALDPLMDSYKDKFKMVDYDEHICSRAEEIPLEDNTADLVVCTNALDHTEIPEQVISEVRRILKPSGYFAVIFCINLALVHPHPAHKNNINENKFHNWVDGDFETINEKSFRKDGYRYGWVKYEGKCGQPAFVWLGRITTKG